MIYVQQQVRSRKRPLVPLNMDNEVKIEFVNISGMEELQFGDSASNDSSSTADFIELVTAEEEGTTDESLGDLHPINGSNGTSGQRPRKRAKLDHLSVEQKAQHRKMMNRISAQSARDRQRALMQQQEQNIGSLNAKNTQLQQENAKLKLANEKLLEECSSLKSSATESMRLKQDNLKLRNLVTDLEKKLKAYTTSKANTVLEKETDTVCSTLEPAVLDTYPQLKGQSLQQASAYLLLTAFFLWISTPQKFSELLKIFHNKYSATTQSSLSNRRDLLLKQLVHQLQWKMEQTAQTKLKPPD